MLLSRRTDPGVRVCTHTAVGRLIGSHGRGVRSVDLNSHHLELDNSDLIKQLQYYNFRLPSSFGHHDAVLGMRTQQILQKVYVYVDMSQPCPGSHQEEEPKVSDAIVYSGDDSKSYEPLSCVQCGSSKKAIELRSGTASIGSAGQKSSSEVAV